MADVIKKNRQNKYLKKCKLVTVPRTSLGLHNADACEEKLVPSKADTPALIHFLVQFSSNICQHLKQIFIHIPSLDVPPEEIQDPKSQVMLAGNSNVRTGKC